MDITCSLWEKLHSCTRVLVLLSWTGRSLVSAWWFIEEGTILLAHRWHHRSLPAPTTTGQLCPLDSPGPLVHRFSTGWS